MEREPLGVVGGGVVGLVTAACFAELGHCITVQDIRRARVAELESATLPIHEPALQAALMRNRARLRYTHEIGDVVSGRDRLRLCRHAVYPLGRRRPHRRLGPCRRAPGARPTSRARDEEHCPGGHR